MIKDLFSSYSRPTSNPEKKKNNIYCFADSHDLNDDIYNIFCKHILQYQ